ncbi:hypothetical protein [Salinimicrobium flavum]|uniref:Cytochrome C and Quinol oxidase polypeptide I n=1 Tax=Salinimicrobium flavum TaxID=1737065 RepID=A0ABW5IXS8_9FLAO
MINLKKHTNIALGYFFLAALLGVFLRFFFVTSIPANFRYVVHAHSHIALLGWVYIGLTTLIYKLYFSDEAHRKTYLKIFWFTQVTLLGMLFTFPFTGYALFSIIFSTLFLIASYFMAWFVIKKVPQKFKETYSFKCIKASLWYLVLSSLGPWAIGGVMATLGNTSIWYKISIYFYLHFQYNAWFILALLGIFFYFLEKRDLMPQSRQLKSFWFLLNSGIILSFFLSVLWVEPHWIFYALAALGAILQLMAFYEFFSVIQPAWRSLRSQILPLEQLLLKVAATLLIIKVVMQLFSAHPYFAQLAYNYTDFVIGYLHGTFLGLISITLFAFLQMAGLLKLSKPVFWIYFVGFLVSEGLIFYKGTGIWLGLPLWENYFVILVAVSSLLPLSVGLMLLRNIFKKAGTPFLKEEL